MNASLASELFFHEGITYYNCAKVLLTSFDDAETFLQSLAPIDFLLRHAAELMLKALIIKGLDEHCISDWENHKLPPDNFAINRMHSLKALTQAWCLLFENSLLPVENLNGYTSFWNSIKEIDNIDFSSTYFRYPLSKGGKINERTEQVEIDNSLISSVPCSIGSYISHEGTDNFHCYHLQPSGFNFHGVVEFLINAYSGIEIGAPYAKPKNGGLL